MPNWCENTLKVTGSREALDEFKKRAASRHRDGNGHNRRVALSFNRFVRMPRKLRYTTSPQDTPNWYDWSLLNWGTKWDLADVRLSRKKDGTELLYEFDTAWSPPTQWLESVVKKYPSLTFELNFEEPGMGFAGILVGDGGEIVENRALEVSNQEEEEEE